MSFTTPRTWVYGETVTEAQLNEQLRDNMNALWTGTTAGDMDYYTSNTTKTRLAGGTANAGVVLRMGTAGTAPEYGGVVTYRQGGSATDWYVAGTTNYSASKTIMQTGCFNIPKYNTSYGFGTVTFPVAFSQKPIVLISSVEYAGNTLVATEITTTTFKASYNGSDLSGGLDISWIAIGEL